MDHERAQVFWLADAFAFWPTDENEIGAGHAIRTPPAAQSLKHIWHARPGFLQARIALVQDLIERVFLPPEQKKRACDLAARRLCEPGLSLLGRRGERRLVHIAFMRFDKNIDGCGP